ncbi:hypothetical protein PIB30_093390, partial [Stylosanthes scabra]|nr:hypothetical protein [Stylosanthes scabra]
ESLATHGVPSTLTIYSAFEGIKVVLRIRGSIIPHVSRFCEASGKPDSEDVGSKRRPTHNPLFPPIIMVVRSSVSPWSGTPSSVGGRTSPPTGVRTPSPFPGSSPSSWVTFPRTGAPGVPITHFLRLFALVIVKTHKDTAFRVSDFRAFLVTVKIKYLTEGRLSRQFPEGDWCLSATVGDQPWPAHCEYSPQTAPIIFGRFRDSTNKTYTQHQHKRLPATTAIYAAGIATSRKQRRRGKNPKSHKKERKICEGTHVNDDS